MGSDVMTKHYVDFASLVFIAWTKHSAWHIVGAQ